MSSFEYNSQRSTLIIPEYGRHIQKMIAYAKTIEDKEKLQLLANYIIELMYQMVPQGKHTEDYRDKLWKHFFKIADYDIDVTPPSNIKPTPTKVPSLADMPYSQSKIAFRHYGKNVGKLIAKAVEMEDGEAKNEFVVLIAAYMKLAYRNWNRDHFVNNENIRTDINVMSEGKLTLPENAKLDFLGSPSKPRRSSAGSGKKRKGGSQQSRSRSFKRRKSNNRY